MRLLISLLCLPALLATLASAAPALPNDVAYTAPTADLKASLTCPNGIKGAKGGTVLLVHGTGSTGEESWGGGPYLDVLPKLSPGFDVCYVTMPNRTLGDIQYSAQYVAYNIQKLGSSSKPISVISHSQGALDTQWALRWWPSTRALVKVFVPLSGDFHGTVMGNGLASIPGATSPSFYQQAASSHFAALTYSDKTFNTALVPTTSIWTLDDEVVEPGPTVNTINGAQVLKDQDVCPLFVADHFLQIVAQPAFALAYQALTKGKADPASFNPVNCLLYPDGSTLNLASVPQQAIATFNDIISGALLDKTPGEPLFRPYVCQAGLAPASSCGNGYFPPSTPL